MVVSRIGTSAPRFLDPSTAYVNQKATVNRTVRFWLSVTGFHAVPANSGFPVQQKARSPANSGFLHCSIRAEFDEVGTH